MTDMGIVPVEVETLVDWQRVHNEIIPSALLTLEDVVERAPRYRLTLGYHDGRLVGNATIRPPDNGESAATVIVRILAEFRGRGFGSQYLDWVLADVRSFEPSRIETVVLASNPDGLSFAKRRGFVEFNRYVLNGQSVPFVELYLANQE
jgi:GNAT superfamily N-acetyltransferase